MAVFRLSRLPRFDSTQIGIKLESSESRRYATPCRAHDKKQREEKKKTGIAALRRRFLPGREDGFNERTGTLMSFGLGRRCILFCASYDHDSRTTLARRTSGYQRKGTYSSGLCPSRSLSDLHCATRLGAGTDAFSNPFWLCRQRPLTPRCCAGVAWAQWRRSPSHTGPTMSSIEAARHSGWKHGPVLVCYYEGFQHCRVPALILTALHCWQPIGTLRYLLRLAT
jgi:hypothetical protein